ncbi:hypothetical protein I4U23_027624 [Adineta vaga]|nr:hypothetical protein I4U23_027624 [Adineta vaga]
MFNQTWLTTSLTLTLTTIRQIMKIFQCAIELRDFRIEYLQIRNSLFIEKQLEYLQRYSATHLKQLYINMYAGCFPVIEYLLQCTPNLKGFTLIANKARKMIDANRWKKLISSSLIYLANFQFRFLVTGTTSNHIKANYLDKLQRFQDDFWIIEHQWIVRYEYSTSTVLVHTIPYPCHDYKLSFTIQNYSLQLNDTTSVFNRVTKIPILYEALEEARSQNFSNIIFLRLKENTMLSPRLNFVLHHKQIESLISMVCLYNVTNLSIDRSYSLESPAVMLRLLNEPSNISWLTIDLRMFRCMFFSNNYSFEKFYETFSELEELECDLDNISEFIPLMHSLSKLLNIAVRFVKYYTERDFDGSWLRDYSCTVTKDFHYINEDTESPYMNSYTERFVWNFKRHAISSV